MTRHRLILAAALAAGGFLGWMTITDRLSFASAQKRRCETPVPVSAAVAIPTAIAAAQPADGAEAGIRKITQEYEKAFNAANAKGAAELWTTEGEQIGADGETVSGRAAIEKSLADYFKANPKITADIQIESVRALARGTANAIGVVRLKTPGEDIVIESRYSALHVLEDGKWRAASVREWVPDPATAITPKNLEWITGDWSAKVEGGELKITYALDENKVFLHSHYTVVKAGKTVKSGMQVFGANPDGGLRVWTFDSTGATGEGLWVRDDKRWINEMKGLLPDGSEVTSLNIIVPLGPNAFTWQTTDRAVDDVPLPALPPIKVTRVQK